MKKTKFFTLFAALAILMLTLCSCAPKITLEEVEEVLPELVEGSKVLNEIYFGEGFEATAGGESLGSYYLCDTSEYEFHSVLEIKEATEEIFSKDYAEVLYQAAFDGVSTDSAVKAPRFAEGDDGLMQNSSDEVYELEDRVFDYTSLAVKKSNSKKITVTVDTYISGEKDVTLELIVARYEDAEGEYYYRLDSPTY